LKPQGRGYSRFRLGIFFPNRRLDCLERPPEGAVPQGRIQEGLPLATAQFMSLRKNPTGAMKLNRPLCMLVCGLCIVLSPAVRAQLTDEQRILHGGPAPTKRIREPIPDEEVRPSATYPNVQTFDFPHAVYFPAQSRQRNQLLLFIPGTQPHDKKGDPEKPSAIRFCKNAALSGYHAVYLMYPNDVAAAEACWDKPDPDAFALFRWALIEGDRRASRIARSSSYSTSSVSTRIRTGASLSSTGRWPGKRLPLPVSRRAAGTRLSSLRDTWWPGYCASVRQRTTVAFSTRSW